MCRGTDLGKVTKNCIQNGRSKNTVAFIILKWKKFVTTKTLPRAGCPSKLSNQGRSALVKEVTKSSSVEMGEPSRRTTISAALHQSGLYSRVDRRKPLLSKRHMTARLKFAKKHLNDSQNMRNKILWSDETKIELFGLNAKLHVWRKPVTIPMVKHCGGIIMLWGCFSAGRDWENIQDRGKDERRKVQRDP